MDFMCLGCNKRLKSINEYRMHSKTCKKFQRVIQLSYDIPVVDIKDLANLEPRSLPDSKEWGVWNKNANDWVKDKAGRTDSRVFERNSKTLLKSIIASSIIASSQDDDKESSWTEKGKSSAQSYSLPVIVATGLCLVVILLYFLVRR